LKNFDHVTPNYTRLNWFRGNRSAYASYQSLITEAMDEAGGQGFATDFAGHLPNLMEQLSTAEPWEVLLTELSTVSDATFIAQTWDSLNSLIQSTIRTALPTSSAFVYSEPLAMTEVFSEQQLSEARADLTSIIENQLIEPIKNSLDILDDDLYLTRLYTTLSADEMTVNPEFTFNSEMTGQQMTRNATLTMACKNQQTEWTLLLGAGTGRDDEIVIEAWEPVPFRAVAGVQEASWRVEKTSATADPVVLAQQDFGVMTLGDRPSVEEVEVIGFKKDRGILGGSIDYLLLGLFGLTYLLARQRKDRKGI